jgi:hypothetical protein
MCAVNFFGNKSILRTFSETSVQLSTHFLVLAQHMPVLVSIAGLDGEAHAAIGPKPYTLRLTPCTLHPEP